MLAKFLKGPENPGFKPYRMPELNGGNPQSGNVDSFTIPEYDDLRYGTNLVEPDAIALPSADSILQNARTEAARIVAEAENNRAIIEEAAHDKARHEAETGIDNEVADKVADLRAQLLSTIEEISSLSADVTAQAEKTLVELALQIAKKIVGREVTIDREIALTLVKVSLSKLHNRSIAEVHLNPIDFVFVQTHREKLDFRGSLDLVEDRSISLGGCLIHTETGDIDARIESQFDEISHGLLG
jgi:flagellar assembly protein FliH